MFVITDRFYPHAESLEFESLTDRAGKGRIGFLGSGVPMLPEERREFERMIADGSTEYVGINKVLSIVD